jgi:hypothetical protein
MNSTNINSWMRITTLSMFPSTGYSLLYPILRDPWVNARDKELEECTDSTKKGHVAETDEVLWN